MWPAWATVGRQSSRCVCNLGGFFMLQSRRGFMIGTGAVLTTALVKDARSFIGGAHQPLLVSPSQVVETMHWHSRRGLSTYPWPVEHCATPPSWQKCFVSEGIPHRTDKEIEKICSDLCI